MNLEYSHPFFKVADFFLTRLYKNPSLKIEFELSRYVYIPNSLNDERHTFKIQLIDFNKEYIIKEIESLKENEELAFHSKILMNDRTYHIGLIDFLIPTTQFCFEHDYIRLKAILPSKIMQNLSLYSSGNSLHGYSLTLLEPKEWRQFMSRLLLIDLPLSPTPLIDTRWIGHRLFSEFGSLRWSNNSGTYKALPELITNKYSQ